MALANPNHMCRVHEVTSSLYEVTLYAVTLYAVTLYEVTLYAVTLYEVTLYEVTLYEVTLYEVTLYEVTLYEVTSTLHEVTQWSLSSRIQLRLLVNIVRLSRIKVTFIWFIKNIDSNLTLRVGRTV